MSAPFVQATISLVSLLLVSMGYAAGQTTSLEQRNRASQVVTDTAKALCDVVKAEGSIETARASGRIQAEINVLARRLANLGVSTEGLVEKSEYQGLPREDLLAALRDILSCRQRVFDRLVGLMPELKEEPSPAAPRSPPPPLGTQQGGRKPPQQAREHQSVNGSYNGFVVQTLPTGKAAPVFETSHNPATLNIFLDRNGNISGTLVEVIDGRGSNFIHQIYEGSIKGNMLSFKYYIPPQGQPTLFMGQLSSNRIFGNIAWVDTDIAQTVNTFPGLPPSYLDVSK